MARTTTASKSRQSAKPAEPAKARAAHLDAPALKPQKRLFLILLTLFILWIAAVLAMYFTTVRPHGGRLEPLPTTQR